MRAVITGHIFKQHKDTKKSRKLKGKYLCNMCDNIFEKRDMIIFVGYEFSPCCQSSNFKNLTKRGKQV